MGRVRIFPRRVTPRRPSATRYASIDDHATREALGGLEDYIRQSVRRILVVVLAAILVATVAQIRTTHRVDGTQRAQDDRDEALKYQVCDQRAVTAIATNATRQDAQDLAATAQAFYAALAQVARGSVAGTERERQTLINTANDLDRKASETIAEPLAPVPDCAATYPVGFEVTKRIGQIAPTIPNVTTPPATTP